MFVCRRPSRLLSGLLAATCALTLAVAPTGTAQAANSSSKSVTAEPRWVAVPKWQLPRLAIGNDPAARGALVALGALDEFSRTRDLDSLSRFTTQRNLLAEYVATNAGVSPSILIAAWSAADLRHQRALLAGLTQIGVPYRWGTMRPGESFDCSGLTLWAWSHAGVTLARRAGDQITRAARVKVEQAQAGDLVTMPGHVLIYLGVKDLVLHAPYSGARVRVDIMHLRDWYRYGNPLHG